MVHIQNVACHLVLTKFYWNIAMSIHLQSVYDCFCAIEVELSIGD